MDDRSLAYVLGEARLQQQNREKILEFASDSISLDPSSTDSVEPISDDWLNIFARFASEKSDIDVQILWAKILVGEIRHPGSTKLRTLQHLATFDKHDATFAHYMLQSTVDGYFLYRDYYTEALRYQDILIAQELGLVNADSSIQITMPQNKPYALLCGNRVIDIQSDIEKQIIIKVNTLTSLGKDLMRLIKNPIADEDLVRHICARIHKQSMIVKIGYLKDYISETQYTVSDLKIYTAL